MINENIIFLNDIKTYSTELLEYVKYNFITGTFLNESLVFEIISPSSLLSQKSSPISFKSWDIEKSLVLT